MAPKQTLGGIVPVRRTPAASVVRYAMAGLVLLGAVTALLGVLLQPWFLKLGIDNARAGNCFLFLNLGILTGILTSKTAGTVVGPAVRTGFCVFAVLAAAGLLLAASQSTLWLLPSLYVVGLAAGILTRIVCLLLWCALTPGGALTILNLAGICFGAGAVAICILAWATPGRPAAWLVTLALASAILAVSAARSRTFAYAQDTAPPLKVTPADWSHPIAFLLGFSLFFQAAGHWVIAGWMALYLTRKFGVSVDIAFWGLALYWMVHSGTCLLASNPQLVRYGVRTLSMATGVNLIGAAFLLQSATASGVMAGAALLGAGTGVVLPMTIGIITKRYPFYHPEFLNAVLAVYLVGGLLAPWLAGLLAPSFGVDVVIWFSMGSSLIVLLLLAVFFVEVRLMSRSVALE